MSAIPSAVFANALRAELSARNRAYADRLKLPYCESYGEQPVICYLPSDDNASHGNFLPQTYAAILNNADWKKRLQKVHAHARECLPRNGHHWRELDSCNSSDALLMNIFCSPAARSCRRLSDLLGVESCDHIEFGVRAKVPLDNGQTDRTEVDMKIGDLLVEAKLTESDFQSREAAPVGAYRDFAEVFDKRSLPKQDGRYQSYQLIRNVLAAHAIQCSFCVMMDERRPDLKERWYAVMRCIRPMDLRLRCRMLTWQEICAVLPRQLQCFLEEKYGISSPAVQQPYSVAAANY